MSDWLSIDPGKFSEPEKKTIRGVEINVYPSPYDIPDAIRGYYDNDKEKFIIEFRYIGERHEKLRSDTEDDHLILKAGKKTGRIYELELDMNALNANAVNLQMQIPEKTIDAIDRAAKTLSRESKKSGNPRNYLLSSKIVDHRKNDLVELQPQ